MAKIFLTIPIICEIKPKKYNMWSDKYYYLNIYKDETLSANWDTQELREFIKNIPELEQVSEYEFKNKDPFPFTQLLLLKARSIDSWSESDTNSKLSNLITIVCEKGGHVDYKELTKMFTPIASFLNWKLVDEETDSGIENFTIWESQNETNIQQRSLGAKQTN